MSPLLPSLRSGHRLGLLGSILALLSAAVLHAQEGQRSLAELARMDGGRYPYTNSRSGLPGRVQFEFDLPPRDYTAGDAEGDYDQRWRAGLVGLSRSLTGPQRLGLVAGGGIAWDRMEFGQGADVTVDTVLVQARVGPSLSVGSGLLLDLHASAGIGSSRMNADLGFGAVTESGWAYDYGLHLGGSWIASSGFTVGLRAGWQETTFEFADGDPIVFSGLGYGLAIGGSF